MSVSAVRGRFLAACRAAVISRAVLWSSSPVMVSRRLTGGAACEACRQQEDAAFAAGAGDAAGGEGGGGGVPVDCGYGGCHWWCRVR